MTLGHESPLSMSKTQQLQIKVVNPQKKLDIAWIKLYSTSNKSLKRCAVGKAFISLDIALIYHVLIHSGQFSFYCPTNIDDMIVFAYFLPEKSDFYVEGFFF